MNDDIIFQSTGWSAGSPLTYICIYLLEWVIRYYGDLTLVIPPSGANLQPHNPTLTQRVKKKLEQWNVSLFKSDPVTVIFYRGVFFTVRKYDTCWWIHILDKTFDSVDLQLQKVIQLLFRRPIRWRMLVFVICVCLQLLLFIVSLAVSPFVCLILVSVLKSTLQDVRWSVKSAALCHLDCETLLFRFFNETFYAQFHKNTNLSLKPHRILKEQFTQLDANVLA